MDFPNLLLKILLAAVGVVAVIIFIWILIGDSPTLTDFLAMVVSGIVLYIVQMNFHQGKFEGEVITSFTHLKEDFTEIKQRLTRIEEKFIHR